MHNSQVQLVCPAYLEIECADFSWNFLSTSTVLNAIPYQLSKVKRTEMRCTCLRESAIVPHVDRCRLEREGQLQQGAFPHNHGSGGVVDRPMPGVFSKSDILVNVSR